MAAADPIATHNDPTPNLGPEEDAPKRPDEAPDGVPPEPPISPDFVGGVPVDGDATEEPTASGGVPPEAEEDSGEGEAGEGGIGDGGMDPEEVRSDSICKIFSPPVF